jgi:uncharacterized protein (TIGR02757 family)
MTKDKMSPLSLEQTLNAIYDSYSVDYINTDPLDTFRRYDDPRDQEIAGFIAALFSLGRADLIKKAVRDLFERMGNSPFRFVSEFDPYRDGYVFDGFAYRFYKDRDVGLMIWWLKQILDKFGSLKTFFLKGYDKKDENIGPSLSRFVQAIQNLKTKPFYPSLPAKGSGAGHWLTDPQDGSGCKRLNLFLRWMVRHDNLDFGLWEEVSPSQLVIPLDTYIARIGRRIGLAKRASADWKMAVEITESLRRFDPRDPVKYDFALCRVGMLHGCSATPHGEKCSGCPLGDFCNIYS